MFEVRQTETFASWLNGLHDERAKARIASRIRQVVQGSLGDHKSVGDRIQEFRIHYGPGYRVYYIRRGKVLIILLCGGDKQTQDKDIKTAKKLAATLVRQP